MFYSFLEALRDGEEHKTNEIKTYCADKFNLTYEERNELFQSGGKIFDERVDRTRKYLKNAGLITSPMRMKMLITDLGQQALQQGPEALTGAGTQTPDRAGRRGLRTLFPGRL